MINVSHCRQLTAGHSLIHYATAGHGPSESLLKNLARGIVALVFLCRPVGGERAPLANRSTCSGSLAKR